MANHYTMAAFELEVTTAEAALLMECVEVAADLEDGDNGPERYDLTSGTFKQSFPLQEGNDDPFASFKAMFDDPDFTIFGCEIGIEEHEDGKRAYFTGENMDISAVANLIQAVCKSALPFGFQWANTCDKMRYDEFGGGYAVITDKDIIIETTGELLDRKLQFVQLIASERQ